ncbi:CRISPR-associated protein (TIGR03984 family) [Anoxybacillus tepidamans]|uniref:CRISPR-associated protein (TIGR03984 family) n=1 Tax=Anoxybacteroides tepidamans TaxID=265948 RepID=A0A7W8MWA1_9BACL|nr:CRISPR-associated protein Csx19 [Anoxybacillus tepidamans]MBB5325136.1 CRISPR-associated protein (TIGR03984 family) [Anoxybacillus tepidamans]
MTLFKVEGQSLVDLITQHMNNQTAYVLVWLDHIVQVGILSNNNIVLFNGHIEEKYVQEIRIFHEFAELHLRKFEGKFIGRMIEDDHSISTLHTFDEKHYVLGSIESWSDGWLRVSEKNRGFGIYIPSNKKILGKLCYQVRNYFKEDEHGQLYFYDARLLGFCEPSGMFLSLEERQ